MDTPSWPTLIRALIGRQALTADQAAWAMNEIMEGNATPAQIAGFGVALRAKGETAAEMSGLAASMVKHGNRAASSACGSADVLEALGVVIDLPASATEALFAEIGIAFLFAALY